jgi:hypothetical protein
MDQNPDPPSFCETCTCGRTFYFPGALKNHERRCSKRKKRLAGALEKAKDLWTSRKKPRLESQSRQVDSGSEVELQQSGCANDAEREVSTIFK